jgi:hypothetical protein
MEAIPTTRPESVIVPPRDDLVCIICLDVIVGMAVQLNCSCRDNYFCKDCFVGYV